MWIELNIIEKSKTKNEIKKKWKTEKLKKNKNKKAKRKIGVVGDSRPSFLILGSFSSVIFFLDQEWEESSPITLFLFN
jgi:hypothetical protein